MTIEKFNPLIKTKQPEPDIKEQIEKTGIELPQNNEKPHGDKPIKDNMPAEDEKHELRLEEKHFLKIIDSARNLINIFYKRNSDRLCPLLDDANLVRIKSAIYNIEGLINQKNIDVNSINNEFKILITSIDTIVDVPKRPPIKEDTQSLNALIIRLRKLREDIEDLIIFASKYCPQQTEEIRIVLSKLCDTCEKKWGYIARLKGVLDN